MADDDQGTAPATQEPAPAQPIAPAAIRALVIVNGSRPPGDGRFCVVAEGRTYGFSGGGDTGEPETVVATVQMANYPTGADLYLRYDPRVQFPASARVMTMGVDVEQGWFGGFIADERMVNVGPAHPAFAAANLAWQKTGCSKIEIVGLTDREKALLGPFFAQVPTHPQFPAPVAVTLS